MAFLQRFKPVSSMLRVDLKDEKGVKVPPAFSGLLLLRALTACILMHSSHHH